MNRLLSWAIFLAGIGLVALSGTQLWFALPAVSHGEVVAETPAAVSLFKFGVLFIGFSVVVGLKVFRIRRTSIVLSSLALAGLLFFPYFVMLRDDSTGARAAWLQMQHENLTWLGGDLSTSFEYRETRKELRTYVVDTPRAMRIVPLPKWSIFQIEPSKFWELLEWLGYGNTFCQFMRRGWVMAFVGMSCLWIATVSIKGRVRSRAVSLGLKTLGATVLTGCVIVLTPPFIAAESLQAARESTARGRYVDAVSDLEAAAVACPPMAHDTHFVAQIGLLESHLKRETPSAALYQANLLERTGRYAQASEIYEQILDDSETPENVRREACRAVLRSAVHTLNSGANAAAARELQLVLANEPANLKALYCLQLVHLRQGNSQKLNESVERLHETYSFFQFANKKIVLAEAERQRLQLALNEESAKGQAEGDAAIAEQHLQRVRRPKK